MRLTIIKINISLCSQKSKSVAVSYRGPSKNVQLELYFGMGDSLEHYIEKNQYTLFEKYYLLRVEEMSKLPESHKLNTVIIGGFQNVPVEMGDKCLNTYWNDRVVGMTAIGDYGREIFNRDIHSLLLGNENEQNDHKRAVDWVMDTQQSIADLYCEFKPKTDRDLDYILENCKYIEDLTLFVKPTDAYCPAKMPNFSLNYLYISPSFWINSQHLLLMNCKTILLQDSKLTHRELNSFLKHWMNGGCFQLKDLKVFVEETLNYETALDGLSFTRREDEVDKEYVNHENSNYVIKNGFNIKRPIDDVTATIRDDGPDSERFSMLVWPDFSGNSYE
ncbi:hypothetical protein CRE_22582 [Caenorhabditis remanei]|uniref:Sdz-33 F-box domain-containing protein n=1 Tax=Caenorhabditis remanei TaxID=31234 RepID=E3N3B2_CAERE|nr:hypothetical protein CRE_22582 [Caenorhabditis remanei]